MSAMLRLLNVSRTHGAGATTVHALRGVSLEIGEGELVAVMGPSGSGKSTLLGIAGTLIVPTQGSVEIDGQSVAELNPTARAELRRRRVGVVFQSYNLLPTLTASENVSLPLELDGRPARSARAEAVAALDAMGLADLADRFPDQLSGGQQQRVAIARALVGTRKLVLADEPTGALDSARGEEIMALLRRRCHDGAAGLLVTHDERHAARADRIVRLEDGVVQDQATPPPAAGAPG